MAVIKFWFSEYTLKPRNKKLPLRLGALLKVQWPDNLVGYADLLPWPDLGDEPLAVQLKGLKKGRMSTMVEQAIWMARRDAQARKEKRNLMRGLPRVRNSLLIQDPDLITEAELGEARRLGFMYVKIKCGKNQESELKLIDKILRMGAFGIRLDFNSRLTLKDFTEFHEKIPTAFQNRVEYIEDPFPFAMDSWKEASQFATLALDGENSRVNWPSMKGPLPFKVLVIKPARIDLNSALDVVNKFGLKMVVTSNLDHPVGVMHAAAIASEVKKSYPNILLDCGTFTHLEYQEDAFSALMPQSGPMNAEVPGLGIGFDELLEKQKWSPVQGIV